MGEVRGRPPSVARRLVALLTAEDDRSYVLSDLEEGFRKRAATSGKGEAWRWYWWQALRAIPWWWSARKGRAYERTSLAARSLPPGLGSMARQALRTLLRRPLYAGGVAATLGLGLGAAGAVFAVAWAVWLQPLPFPDPERVVRVYEVNLRPIGDGDGALTRTASASPSRWNALSPPLLTDLQQADLTTIESVAAISSGNFDWAEGDALHRVAALLVSPDLFGMLGVRPLHGRVASDERGTREVVLTSAFWERSFGGDPGVVSGRTMLLDGETYAIVGVIKPPDGYPQAADIWVPLTFEAGALQEGMRGARYLETIARVRPGRTVADAAAEIDAFVRHLALAHPNHREWGGHAESLRDDLVRPFRSVLMVLLAAGSVFVLLATVNVAGLVAARRAENRQARAIRIALGASHRQILREGLVESTMLGLAGATVGVAAVFWVLAPLRRLIPDGVPRLSQISIGPGLLGGLLIAGAIAGILVGLIGHALSGVRDRPAIGRNRDAGRPGVLGRRALLVTQVALTTWLLIGGVALIRYANVLRRMDFGFRPDGVATALVTLSHQRQGASAELSLLFWQEVLRDLEARGAHAAVATNPPVSGSSMQYGYAIQGEASQYWGQYHAVTAAYFAVLGTDLVAGRAFTDADGPAAAPVVIVNEQLARQHFPNEDALGRTLQVVGTGRTIIGVARSTRHFGPDREPPAELYVPLAQDPSPFAHVLVRSNEGSAADVLADVIARIDAQVLVPPLLPFGNYISTWFAPLRLQVVILGVFGAVGAFLAALGIYALVAYVVSNGVREIGIRLALGERSEVVFRRVLGHGLTMTVIGAAAGIAVAAATRQVLRQFVRVDPIDPVVVLIVSGVVTMIALLASVLPACRAIRVDPIVTLRAE